LIYPLEIISNTP